jgi:DNA-directed RNA polymerase subunit H (RpoH/RPB5)
MDAQSKFNPIYRSYGVSLEMLTDRGFVTGEKLNVINFFNLLKDKTNNSKFIYSKPDGWRIQLFFVTQTVNSDSQNLGKKDIEIFRKIIEKTKVQGAILLLFNIDVTSYAKKEIESLKPEYYMECFNAIRMQINITHHVKVPKHILLSEKATKELLQKQSCKLDAMPKIQKEDPVALYYAAQPGQIFRIEKKSESSGIYTEYRVVI